MSLLDLSVADVRCIERAELQIAAGLTLLWGDNGSGKTSLLEAIFMLGRGRSFRTRNNERLIRYGQNQLRVTGSVTHPITGAQRLGFEAVRGSSSARVGGRQVESLSELSRALAVAVIEPGVHRLVEEGGYRRRRWLDWAVFHVEPRFIDVWLRYTRALKQRNAALKASGADASAWDLELARLGESIAESRRRLMEQLEPYWHAAEASLVGLDVELHYQRGWTQEHTLLEALAGSRSRDEIRQLTHAGPHRADVAVRIHGRPARDVLSRGQQKLAAVAMTVAQLRLLQDVTDVTPTLLLDDPAAELDGERLQRFTDAVATLRCQLVVTSLRPESRLFGAPERTFRMGQGRLEPV